MVREGGVCRYEWAGPRERGGARAWCSLRRQHFIPLSKRNSVCCQINQKTVIAAQIWFDLVRFRKYLSVCGLQYLYQEELKGLVVACSISSCQKELFAHGRGILDHVRRLAKPRYLSNEPRNTQHLCVPSHDAIQLSAILFNSLELSKIWFDSEYSSIQLCFLTVL